MSKGQVTLGWIVKVKKQDGTVRYHGERGQKSAHQEKVPFFPDERKAKRAAQQIKKKHPGWVVVTMQAYTDPPDLDGSWQPFVETEPTGGKKLAPGERMYANNYFTVFVQGVPADGAPEGGMIHLSIKHNSKCAAHDWRAFQRIKNELLGPEYEAVELYPAESRRVDQANQFHLWAFAKPGIRFPIGFNVRTVSGPDEAKANGARQRGGTGIADAAKGVEPE